MLQRHPLTGEWVLLATSRGQRPDAFDIHRRSSRRSPADCPFCPGNEHETPPEVLRKESGSGWRVRVVPNRYPATESVRGVHEVIIETPDHHEDFDALPLDHATTIIATYAERYVEIARNTDVRFITIFKNDGEGSGQSIDHLHSQVLGLPLIPPRAELLMKGFQREPCALCLIVQSEPMLIRKSEQFLLVVPPVPLFPYELWVVPRRHTPSCSYSDETILSDLARLLQDAVRAIDRLFDRPSFNWIFHNSPLPELPYFHWFVQIFPRLALQGGFELGSGMQISIVDPRDAAAELRKTIE